MYSLCPQSLKSDRFNLRLTSEADLPDFYAMHSIDAVNQYIPYNSWTQYQDALDWFAKVQLRRSKAESQQYTICLNSDGRFIGSCLVFGFDQDTGSAEIGYVLHPDYWGKGYMFEAMQVFVAGLHQHLQLKQITACVEQANLASLGLLRKLGFKHSHISNGEDGVILQHGVLVWP